MADTDDRDLEIAALRYRVIAEAAEADEGGVTAAIVEAAEREHRGLDGETFHVAERTLWRWLEAYRSGNVAALKPKPRSDAGRLRAFKPEVLDKAAKLRRTKPSRATKTIIVSSARTGA